VTGSDHIAKTVEIQLIPEMPLRLQVLPVQLICPAGFIHEGCSGGVDGCSQADRCGLESALQSHVEFMHDQQVGD